MLEIFKTFCITILISVVLLCSVGSIFYLILFPQALLFLGLIALGVFSFLGLYFIFERIMP